MQITIAVVQFEIEQFAPERNLAKAERFIQTALREWAYAQAYPIRGRPRSQPWRNRPPVQRSRERLS